MTNPINNAANLMRFWPIGVAIALGIAAYVTLADQVDDNLVVLIEHKEDIGENKKEITELEKVTFRIEVRFEAIQKTQEQTQEMLRQVLAELK